MKKKKLVIIGAGPGGISAAIAAARAGVDVTVLDENKSPGGQIYRQYEEGYKIGEHNKIGKDYLKGKKLIDEFFKSDDKIEYLNETLVWGIFDDNEISYQYREKSYSITYDHLIVAPGAYDRPVPFPGWTLPGVFTAGAAQRLVKLQGILPGERILLAGTGPLQLILAYQILKLGGKIEAILEAGNITNWFKYIKGMCNQLDLAFDGIKYLSAIKKAGVPILRNHIVLEAHGNKHVKEAVIAPVDKKWHPQKGRKTIPVDTICLGYGLIPNTKITQLLGCEHEYNSLLGGWVPIRSGNMETNLPGVYAVGDGSGIGGSKMAATEGTIAGYNVAKEQSCMSEQEFSTKINTEYKILNKMKKFREVLDEISAPRAGLYELAKDDTIICRCEELSLIEIKDAVNQGFVDIEEIKRLTRCGMGNCQGLNCEPVLKEIVERIKKDDSLGNPYLKRRTPIKPIKISSIANHQYL